ncbi:STAS domain-containing protein [Streptomyces pharetrae]|uniref:STAS domain-containing protein n=1 Tax=Streptomyces pharetrae TaxID=291370 RepID=UPI00334F37E8
MAEEQMADTEQAAQSGQLSAVVTATDGIRVVALAGEIDHHTADTLRHALDATDESCPRVVVDMGKVTFMDSSGINIFIAAHRGLSEAGGWLRLAAPTENVMRTMSIVGLDGFVDCRASLSQALGD